MIDTRGLEVTYRASRFRVAVIETGYCCGHLFFSGCESCGALAADDVALEIDAYVD
jgi:hypothetical protein